MVTNRSIPWASQPRQKSRSETGRQANGRTTRLTVEGLEPRLLLYAISGAAWPHRELVTVSFMPDGTNVGGVPSVLNSTMNARFPTATWQKEMLRGLQSYAANSNLNFSIAADDGSPFGSAGSNPGDHNVQGDNDFGDIRMGAVPLGSALGLATLPAPFTVDTTAGDFLLNSSTLWNIGSTFDLYTVTAHEAGHSLGLCHSSISTAVLYESYNGVKSNLTADDIAGIQAIYGSRYADGFDAWSPNESKASATDINAYIDANKQLTITGIDITTDADVDWYKFTIPSGSAGSMEVRVQSTGLSLLAPKFTLYKGSHNKGTVSGSYHSTVSQVESISSGQNWFVKVQAAEPGVFGTGQYGLQINMGSSPLIAVPIPNTDTPAGGYPQVGCDTHQHAHDHDHDHDVTAESIDVQIAEHEEHEEHAEGARSSDQATSTLDTNFDFEQSSFARGFHSVADEDVFPGHKHRANRRATAVDLALSGGLADLLADALAGGR